MQKPQTIDNQVILNLLSGIKHPESGKNLSELNFIKGLVIAESKIGFILDLPHEQSHLGAKLKDECEKILKSNFPNYQIQIAISKTLPNPKSNSEADLPPLQIKKIIAISSAKGGVGKSTTTVNLAMALQNKGSKVGILDADVYGPSIPLLLDIHDKPESDGKMMIPLEKKGIKAMSIGFLLPKEGAAIWRGPMVSSAIQQMTYQVQWGELDYLLIDMPPGTGDIHLTLVQKLKLNGAIIVSTPQEIALQDTLKGIEMFQKTNVPILGMIENMSYFICDGCDKKHYIFDQNGMKEIAQKKNIPFLAEIPFQKNLQIGQHNELYEKIIDYVLTA